MRKKLSILSIFIVAVILCSPIAGQENQQKADLGVNVYYSNSEANVAEANVGDKVEYNIYAMNYGPDDATGVKVTTTGNTPILGINRYGYWHGGTWNELDPKEADVSSLEEETINWNIGNMLANGEYILILAVDTSQPGSFGEYVEITGDQDDPNLENNEATATLEISEEGAETPKKISEEVKVTKAEEGKMTKAAEGKVPMQPTGAPMGLLVLAVLMTGAGLITSRIS